MAGGGSSGEGGAVAVAAAQTDGLQPALAHGSLQPQRPALQLATATATAEATETRATAATAAATAQASAGHRF